MSWFLVILFLTTALTFSTTSSESIHVKKNPPSPSAVVIGTVYCDTCSKQEFSFGSHFISGASVAVECKDGKNNSKLRFKKEVQTNENGEFRVQLPFSVRKHVKRIKGCTFKLVSSSEPDCAVASEATSSSLRIKSRNHVEHIFSAGLFSFKPNNNNNNNLCNQKEQKIENSKESVYVKNKFPPNIDPSFPPPLRDPPTPGILPPLPLLPPLLPPLPEIPLTPPIIGKTKELVPNPNQNPTDEKEVSHPQFFFFPPLVPNPFQPPPLIPNPLQPPPLIPLPFQPPPSLPNPFRPPSPPLLPNPFQPPSPPPLFPNPFQPPPSPTPLIPNPFQPPPSPTPLIPNPFQPPPSPPPPFLPNPFHPPPSPPTPTPTPLFPFPPIPGLTPSPPPPPPPPPIFPFPPLFPPLFPPPRSPGSPPASPLNKISP